MIMQLATPFLILSSSLPAGKTKQRKSKASTEVAAPDSTHSVATHETANEGVTSHNLGKLLASCCDCV
jgi:hypothetical protein